MPPPARELRGSRILRGLAGRLDLQLTRRREREAGDAELDVEGLVSSVKNMNPKFMAFGEKFIETEPMVDSKDNQDERAKFAEAHERRGKWTRFSRSAARS